VWIRVIRGSLRFSPFEFLAIRICFGFRDSDFGFCRLTSSFILLFEVMHERIEPKRLVAVRTVREQARLVPGLSGKIQTGGSLGRQSGRARDAGDRVENGRADR